MIRFLFCFLLLLSWATLKSQVVLQPITSSVYEFLDEMAQEKIIELNSAIKPYSRMFIAQKLDEIAANRTALGNRQQKELNFYLKDFNKELIGKKGTFEKRKDLFYYNDSLFTLTINPILGFKYGTNENGNYSHRWNGGELYGTIGTHFGFYASLRDNGISDILTAPQYLTTAQGGNFKFNQGQSGQRSDYSEMLGGIFYSWKWGRLGVVKDNHNWGDNYHGANIFSGKNPSVGYIDFKINPTKWFELNYIHSWLVSEVMDSSRIFLVNNQKREVFTNKNLAANLFTIKPFKNFYFSFGNSVVYADDGVKPIYFIPFMFFKSIDHTYNGAGSNALGQNSQMFINISSRQIKHLHLYTTIFIDEISIGNMWDKNAHSNIFSAKVGFKINNFPIKNTYFITEYTRTNPWTYRHQIETTTFASNQYNLGHYLGENAQEIYLEAGLKIIRGLKLAVAYTNAQKGDEHVFEIIFGNGNIKGLNFMENVAWENKTIEAIASYEIINDGFIFARAAFANIKGNNFYTPELMQGKTTTITAGINFGF